MTDMLDTKPKCSCGNCAYIRELHRPSHVNPGHEVPVHRCKRTGKDKLYPSWVHACERYEGKEGCDE